MDTKLLEHLRVLLTHFSGILDVIECYPKSIDPFTLSRDMYMQLLHHSVVREAIEHDEKHKDMEEDLHTFYRHLHKQLLAELEEKGHRNTSVALGYWKRKSITRGTVSPEPFNMVARPSLASQASSASAERFFSDSGRLENRQALSLLTSTTEMTEFMRFFTTNKLTGLKLPRSGALHPTAASFKHLVTRVEEEILHEH